MNAEDVGILRHPQGDPALVRQVLDDLPDWFGQPDALDHYVAASSALPMIEARHLSNPIGVACLQATLPGAVEITCMGLMRAHHGRGFGQALMAGIILWARDHDARLLVVRTIGPSHPDPFYARTRRFYTACGFLPAFETTELWGPENPCLIMVLPLVPPIAAH